MESTCSEHSNFRSDPIGHGHGHGKTEPVQGHTLAEERPPLRRSLAIMRIGNYLASATTLVIVGVTTLLVGVLITEEHHRALDAKRSAASMFTELFASSLSALVVFDDRDEVHKDLDNLRKTEGVVAAAIWLPNAPAPVASFGPNLEQSGPEVEITADRMIVTRPVVDREHDTIATVRIAFSLEAENALMAATTRSLLVGGAIVTAAVIASPNRAPVNCLRGIGRGPTPSATARLPQNG